MKKNHKWVSLMDALQWGDIDHWEKFPENVFGDNLAACKEWVRKQLNYFEDPIKQHMLNFFFYDMKLNSSLEYAKKDIGVEILKVLYKKERNG